VAESEDDLPATVASRCRVMRFGRVPEAELSAALEMRGVDSERAAMTARIAGGSPGLALDLVADRGVGEFRRRWLAVPTKVSSVPGDGFRLADEMLKAHVPLLDAVKVGLGDLYGGQRTVADSLGQRGGVGVDDVFAHGCLRLLLEFFNAEGAEDSQSTQRPAGNSSSLRPQR